MPRQFRSFLYALLAALFTLGLAGHGYAATGMALSMNAAMQADMASDEGPSSDCDNGKAKSAACMAACVAVVGVLSESAQAGLIVTSESLDLPSEARGDGLSVGPEPPRPKA